MGQCGVLVFSLGKLSWIIYFIFFVLCSATPTCQMRELLNGSLILLFFLSHCHLIIFLLQWINLQHPTIPRNVTSSIVFFTSKSSFLISLLKSCKHNSQATVTVFEAPLLLWHFFSSFELLLLLFWHFPWMVAGPCLSTHIWGCAWFVDGELQCRDILARDSLNSGS